MVGGKPVVNGVYVTLEAVNVVVMDERFVECGIVCIDDQRTVGRKVRKTKIINIDKKKKWPQDRALGNTGENWDRIRGDAMDGNRLGSVRKVGPKPTDERAGDASRLKLTQKGAVRDFIKSLTQIE
jgi:hypothetical protein